MLRLFVIFDQYPEERRPIIARRQETDDRFLMAEPTEIAMSMTASEVGAAIKQFHEYRPFSYRFEVDPIID